MGDTSAATDDWASYLRRMTDRPGWSVARLARESGVHRGTIFKWLSGNEGVTVASVRTIATALGDDVTNALRAAAGMPPATQEAGDAKADPVIQWILDNPAFDEDEKVTLIKRELARIERERAARIAELEWLVAQRERRGTA